MTGKEKLNDLMTEFDEMGYCPTTLCPDPDAAARDWKVRLMCAVNQIEREARKEILQEVAESNAIKYDNFDMNDLKKIAKKYGVKIDNGKTY